MLRGLSGAASGRPLPCMPAPFILLILSICAVWAPKPPRGFFAVLPLWTLLYAIAAGLAFVQGIVQPLGIAALLLLFALAAWTARSQGTRWYGLAWVLLLALSAALALHQVPGFQNPVAISGVRFSDDAVPFTQFLNFDKGSVGQVLLAWLAPRLRRGDPLGQHARTTACAWSLTTAIVLALAVVGGVVRPDFKWPPQTALFLVTNLFLTCVAEQAMFRTLVQDPLRGAGLANALTRRAAVAMALSALLFGLAHAGGGAWMAGLAGLAGLGHAIVYEKTRRIEAAILVHFGLNAMHFLAFTYPALALR